MAKNINAIIQSLIDQKNFAGTLLVKMYFDPSIRYCSAYQSVYWDEPAGIEESPGGEVEYEGMGKWGSISSMPESMELSSQQIQLSLSGIPAGALTDALGTEYQGKPVYIWYALTDENYTVQDNPVLVFAGLMDYANIVFGELCDITLNCTPRS